jgi:uncharacterized membrane protein
MEIVLLLGGVVLVLWVERRWKARAAELKQHEAELARLAQWLHMHATQGQALADRVAALERAAARLGAPAPAVKAAFAEQPAPSPPDASAVLPPDASAVAPAQPVSPPPLETPSVAPPERGSLEPPLPAAPPISPPPTPAPSPAPSPPPAPPPARRQFDWENLVGVRLFSWIAGIALVLAAVFFLRYSVEQGWLGPPVRMAIGMVVGVALLVVCELRGARYRVTANALDAAGIAILFSTAFASNALWQLLPQLPTFGLMVLITAVAVLLSIRHDSLFIALLGLIGGFATPALLSTGQDEPIGLFGYLILLNCGLAWVAYKKRWAILVPVSLGLTTVYQWGWVVKFVFDKPAELPLAAAIFLVIPTMMAAAHWLGTRAQGGSDLPKMLERSVAAAAALPLFFALCMAWVPAFGERHGLMFGFLFILDCALLVLAAARGPALLHAAGGLSTFLVFVGWLATSYGENAWPAAIGYVALFVTLYLFAPLIVRRLGRDVAKTLGYAAFTAPLLLFAFPVLVLVEPKCAHPLVPFGALFVLAAMIGAVAVATETGGLHFLAAFFTVAAEGAWSAEYLTLERLHASLLLYAGFGALYLGVPVLARRFGKRFSPQGSGIVVLIASLALLFFLAAGPVAQSALWGMGLLLAVLNLGIFFEARTRRLSLFALFATLLSWAVIAVWWATAMVVALLVPALVIVTGFALLVVGGNLWAGGRTRAEGDKETTFFGGGVFLGLVGHLFLLFVASQRELSVPPWPMFGVMLVLDLAVVAAALYARKAELHAAALALSQAIVVLWIAQARTEPAPALSWPEVALLAAAVVAGIGLLMLPLAKRRGATDALFWASAPLALVLAQIAAVVVGAIEQAPSVLWLASAHAVFLLALAVLAARRERDFVLLIGLGAASLGVFFWRDAHFVREAWFLELVFAAVPYAICVLYPFAIGARAREARWPFITAVVANLPFFALARHAMNRGGQGGIIAVLPVGQAVVLLALVAYVLRIEDRAKRDRGRLALLAGTALAFITMAIPLQLENEWVTIGWALEAAALAWIYGRIDHKGLLASSLGLALAVAIRLTANPAVFAYHDRSSVALWNWYLYTYGVSAAALFAAAFLLSRRDDRLLARAPRASTLQTAGATLLLFLLLNIEIADYYSTGRQITFNFSSTLAQDLTYTLGWATFAVVLLAAGIVRASGGARIAALVLLVLTVAKCFLHDLWRLGGLYRVGSFVGLAVCLALVAIVLQKFVLAPIGTSTEKS